MSIPIDAHRKGDMVTSFATVEHFIEQSKRAATPHELESLMAGITADLGFDYFALLHHVDLSRVIGLGAEGETAIVALTNYPDSWVEAYISRNLMLRDPVHLASRRTNVGFRWSDLGSLINLTAEHCALLQEARQGGVADGFTIPANVPGEPNGSCTFTVGPGKSLPEQNLLMAQTAGSYAFEAARTMRLKGRGSRNHAHASLTPRQLECVVLIGRGKTDAEISRELGVREQTVTEHINQARQRYQVGRRAQLVLHALYRGEVHFADIFGSPAL